MNDKSNEYKYNINDIVNNKIILNQIKMSNGMNKLCKGYRVKCTFDGYEWEMTEYNLTKRGCPICSNKICITGINDIATTHPHLVKYFKNIEDAYVNTHSVKSKVDLICPYCGFERYRKIDGISREGFKCPKCGDGTSIPEKFLLCVLEQLKIDFNWEIKFKWSNNKRYDFYIKDYNCIIETHGKQHYISKFTHSEARTLDEEQENDRLKEQLAKESGIKNYIVIDCRKSELEFIKNNIINSKLNELFDLSTVDWIKCYEYSHSSRVKEACDLWNNGVRSTKNIGEIMKMSSPTICSYLKIGKDLSWCDYDKSILRKNQFKKVLFIEENIIFDNAINLANYLSETYMDNFNASMIKHVCRGRQNNYKGFHFTYI